jgi:hypothetical protein
VLLQDPQWFKSVAISVHSPVQHAGAIPKQGVAVQAPQWVSEEDRSVQAPEQQAGDVPEH